jgi:hypothetical protein
MSDPTPLDDADLDRLLGFHEAPPLSGDFADRLLAEALREDRPAPLPPVPRSRPPARRWRRGAVAGLVAAHLLLASAVAAAITGYAPPLAHVFAVARHALQFHRYEAPPHHAHPPAPKMGAMRHDGPALAPGVEAGARRAPSMAPLMRDPVRLERPVEIRPVVHPLPPERRGMPPRGSQQRQRALRMPPHPAPFMREEQARRGPPARLAEPQREERAGIGVQGMGRQDWGSRAPWNGAGRGPWAQGWRAQNWQERGWQGQRPGMRAWRQQGAGGWRRGGRGMGWRRGGGRGRRF